MLDFTYRVFLKNKIREKMPEVDYEKAWGITENLSYGKYKHLLAMFYQDSPKFISEINNLLNQPIN